MRSITITDTESGQTYAGHLPTGWHEVPVSAFQQFARLQAGRRPQLQLLSAVQALTDLPAEVLEADVSLAANLALQLPWFFEAMPAGEPAPVLVHRGVTYEHQADFGRLTGGQFEALLAFLDAAEGNPGVAAPNLLAVLLVRRGVKQDAKAVREATTALASLPMAQAWPYVAGFISAWSASAVEYPALFRQAKSGELKEVAPSFDTGENIGFTGALLWHSRRVNTTIRDLRKWPLEELLEDMAYEKKRHLKPA